MKENRYRIQKKLAAGGGGTAWLAWDVRLRKNRVIKEIALDGQFGREEAEREIEALEGIKHRDIPSLLDVLWERDRVFLVLEYMEGETLQSLCERRGPLSEKEALQMAMAMLSLVDYLHSRSAKIVHGDLKPANFVWDGERLALLDFGTASGGQGSGRCARMGTPGYAPPECVRVREADESWDIYSLGACLFYLASGQEPENFGGRLPPLRQINPRISRGYEELVAGCLREKKEDRFWGVREMLVAAKKLAERKTDSGRLWRRGKKSLAGGGFYFWPEKNILLAEKRVFRGLMTVALLCFCFWLFKADGTAAGRSVKQEARSASVYGSRECFRGGGEEHLPVSICSGDGEKRLVDYRTPFVPSENPMFEIPLACFERGEAYEITILQVRKRDGSKRERTFVICAP